MPDGGNRGIDPSPARAFRGRKKKLLIAFHFQFSSPAAWTCDSCRSSGLVKVRNCAWLKPEQPAREKAVWARGGIYSAYCPKSVITPQSLYLLDQFRWWKEAGGGGVWHMEAKAADAVMLLERAWQTEIQRGEQ